VDISATLTYAESVSEKWRVMARSLELKNHLGKGFAFERSEKSQNLTPPSTHMNNKRNMNQRNIKTKELTKPITSIEGGVLPEAEQVRYWAGKIIRHSAELSRSLKSKI